MARISATLFALPMMEDAAVDLPAIHRPHYAAERIGFRRGLARLRVSHCGTERARRLAAALHPERHQKADPQPRQRA
jgi:hypothetical protein